MVLMNLLFILVNLLAGQILRRQHIFSIFVQSSNTLKTSRANIMSTIDIHR